MGNRRGTVAEAAMWLVVALTVPAAPAAAQWQKNEYQQQKEAAARFEPAPLTIRRRAGGAPTRMRVRFYSDDAYRSSGGARWQDRLRAQLGQLNELLEPAFAVRLEPESFRRWERRSPNGALAPMLEELEQLDPGPDVDWVVGLVAPLPLVSMSFHDLGWATLLGRHFVLRSMSSIAELDDFNREFRALDREQREGLYSRRKLHKELAIFLHEWAHTLGALHVADDTRIMGPAYSQRSSVIKEDDAGLLAAGLQSRLASSGAAGVDWSPLRRFLTEHRSPDWLPAERATLERLLASSSPGGTTPRPGPARPAATPAPPEAGDPPFVGEARAHLRANRRAQALAVAQQASQSAAADGEIWVALGRIYAEIGALTAAEEALVRAGAAPGVPRAAAELVKQRRALGLPRKVDLKKGSRFRLAPEAEADYAAAVLRARELVTADAGRARQVAEQELGRFPGAPGLLVVACEASMLSQRAREAARSCEEALAVMDDLPRAHYLSGLMAANGGRLEAGIKSLRRAIELAPDQQVFWKALGEVYRVAGRSREFRALLADQERAAATPGAETGAAATPRPPGRP
jgi:tetratricopeptide (TPR) repeat protein